MAGGGVLARRDFGAAAKGCDGLRRGRHGRHAGHIPQTQGQQSRRIEGPGALHDVVESVRAEVAELASIGQSANSQGIKHEHENAFEC